jgi:hypothetical protein
MTSIHKTKWFLPAFSLALGGACLVAFSVGGNLREGLYSLAVMAGLALILLVSGRSELVRGLRGDGKDESGSASICTPRRSPAWSPRAS